MNQIHRIEAVLLSGVFILLITGLVLSHADLAFFESVYVIEDGPLEWLTVVALAVAGSICLMRLLKARFQHHWRHRAVLIFLIFFCFFGAGEEISWGQRIFNIETPEFFQDKNAQGELGFHNLKFGDVKINKLVFGRGLAIMMIIYLFIMTPLYRRQPKFQHWIDQSGIPMPRNHHIYAYLLVVFIVEVLVDSKRRGELTEFAGSFVFLMNIWFAYNRDQLINGGATPPTSFSSKQTAKSLEQA